MWNNLPSYSLRCLPLCILIALLFTLHTDCRTLSLSCVVFLARSRSNTEIYLRLTLETISSVFIFSCVLLLVFFLVCTFSFWPFCPRCSSCSPVYASSVLMLWGLTAAAATLTTTTRAAVTTNKKSRQIPLQQYDSFAGRTEFGADIQNIHRYRCTTHRCARSHTHTQHLSGCCCCCYTIGICWALTNERNMHKRAH